jgi:IMP dehydrogenase/GMP reductase
MTSANPARSAPRVGVALTSVTIMGIAVLLSGCTTMSATPHSDGRVVVAGQARLDEASDSVVFPLDKYIGPVDTVIYHAQELATRKCMALKGFDWQVSIFQGVDNPVGFRQFGLWDMTDAVQYGYGIRPDPVSEAIQAMNRNLSAAGQAALPDCDKVGQNKFQDPRGTGMSKTESTTSASALKGAAYRSTMNDPAAKKLISSWQKCMKDKGITANTVKTGPLMAEVNTTVTPLEQQIKIAVQEVQCKTAPPSIIQQLVDIDASYQVVSIGRYQTVLTEQLTKFTVVNDAAKKYIAQSG